MTDEDDGMKARSCAIKEESPFFYDKSRFLVLVNYFRSIPIKELSCEDNSGNLINMLHTCDGAIASRWINFVVVDYYKACLALANYLIFSSLIDIDNRTKDIIIICFFYYYYCVRAAEEWRRRIISSYGTAKWEAIVWVWWYPCMCGKL